MTPKEEITQLKRLLAFIVETYHDGRLEIDERSYVLYETTGKELRTWQNV